MTKELFEIPGFVDRNIKQLKSEHGLRDELIFFLLEQTKLLNQSEHNKENRKNSKINLLLMLH